MAKCAGCGGNAKTRKSIIEEINGKPLMFCCQGCRRLYEINAEVIKMEGPRCH